MKKLRIVMAALGIASLAGCAGVVPFTDEFYLNRLPATAAGAPGTETAGDQHAQLASESGDPCSGSRRMSRIRCWR